MPDTIACTWAGCRSQASFREDGYALCSQHVLMHRQQKASGTLPPPAAPRAQAAPSPIGVLLEQASGHSSPKVRRLAERIELLLGDLRTLLREEAEADEARKRVAALEAELAKAKAALKRSAPDRRVHRKKDDADHACGKCGRACASGTGRAAHERHCTGQAA